MIIITSNTALKNVLQKGDTRPNNYNTFPIPTLYGYPIFYVSLFPLSTYAKTNVGKE
jgi:hypothetical protein